MLGDGIYWVVCLCVRVIDHHRLNHNGGYKAKKTMFPKKRGLTIT